jgi:hypothetical protein
VAGRHLDVDVPVGVEVGRDDIRVAVARRVEGDHVGRAVGVDVEYPASTTPSPSVSTSRVSPTPSPSPSVTAAGRCGPSSNTVSYIGELLRGEKGHCRM